MKFEDELADSFHRSIGVEVAELSALQNVDDSVTS
jgi:hypothetical protein